MGVVKEKVAAEYLVVAVVNQSINQSINQFYFRQQGPYMKNKEKRKTHKHTVVKQTDRQTLKLLCTIIWQVQPVQCRYKNIATRGPFAIEHMVSITYNSFKARQSCF